MLTYSCWFIVGLLIIYFIGYKAYGMSLNPLMDVIGFLFIAFAIFYSADFINHDLSSETVVMYVLGSICFCVGLIFSQILKNKRVVIGKIGYLKTKCDVENEESEYFAHYQVVKIGFVITSIVFIITVYWIVFHVGVAAFFNDIFKSVRDTMRGTALFTFNEILKKSLIIFCPMEILFAQKYKEKRVMCYFFVALALVVSLSFTRVMFLYLLIVDLLTFYFNKNDYDKGKNVKNRLIALAIVLLAVVFFNNTQESFNKVMNTTGSIAGYQLSNGQLTILSYFFAPLKSTDVYISMKLETLPLVATFRYFYEYILRITTSAYVDVPFVRIPFSFNTAHGFYYIYREGGFLWLIFLSVFYGFISDRVYMSYRKAKTSDNICGVCFLTLCLLMGIRSYLPMFLEFWIPLITFVLVKRKMMKARAVS